MEYHQWHAETNFYQCHPPLATDGIAARFSGPLPLLAVTILLSGILSAFLVTITLFFAGAPIALVALGAAMMMLDRVRPGKIYRAVDWPLLIMFMGLFVVVRAFEVDVVRTWGLERMEGLRDSPVVMVSLLSVVLSNLISNVPAVLLFRPLMDVMTQKEAAWLALAMSRPWRGTSPSSAPSRT